MRHFATTLMLGVILLLSVLLAWLILTPIPTTQELDADLNQLRSEIKQATDAAENYAPSAIRSLIELRRQTLENTEAMLKQKKASVPRRVSLSYRIDGQQVEPASDKELTGIKDELAQAEQKISQSIKNAEQYSGGLAQALALMTVETDRLSASQLRLKFYLAKHGLPAFGVRDDKKPDVPAGRITQDKDAL